MNEGKKIPSWNFFLLKKALYVQKKNLDKILELFLFDRIWIDIYVVHP